MVSKARNHLVPFSSSVMLRSSRVIRPLCTKPEFTLDFAGIQVTCPGGQRVPMVLGTPAQCPAAAYDGCAVGNEGTKAMRGKAET